MKITRNGWVVINIGHPNSGNKFINESTFRARRTDAIKSFIEGSQHDWNYWKNKYNFRVVKAEQAITTI